MQDKFQRPVDLKEKLNQQNSFESDQSVSRFRRSNGKPELTQAKPAYAESSGVAKGAIDAMFSNNNKDGENNLHKIDRAGIMSSIPLFKIVVVVLIIAFVSGAWLIFGGKDKKADVAKETRKEAWSAVMLVSGEVYYGLVGEIDKNPIVISNVYYDYDQVNNSTSTSAKKESGSLRLVKRGKENYGPDGKMTIFQAQIKYIEALKLDSKVLKAILDHEGVK